VASLSQGRTAAAQCGLFTHKSVPVIFEPPCNLLSSRGFKSIVLKYTARRGSRAVFETACLVNKRVHSYSKKQTRCTNFSNLFL